MAENYESTYTSINFIEIITILQLITIRNSSDGNNVKPQTIERLVK